MRSWSVLSLVALPGEIAVRAGVDPVANLPGVILSVDHKPPREAWEAEQSALRMAVRQRDPPSKRFRVLDRPLDVLVGMPRSGHRHNPSRQLTVVTRQRRNLFFAACPASAGSLQRVIRF